MGYSFNLCIMKMVNVRQFLSHILITILIFGIFIAVIIILKKYDLNPATKLPCEYFDSINITDGIHQNGDIIYKNITFPKDQYALVNTVLGYVDGIRIFGNGKVRKDKIGEFMEVEPYYRGCLCNRKKCIRLCCNGTDGCLNHNFENDLEIELKDQSFTSLVGKGYTFVTEPCAIMRMPEKYINIQNDTETISKMHSKYCLNTKFDGEKKPKIQKKPLLRCIENEVYRAEMKLDVRSTLTAYLFFISVPFTVVTALVYIFIPELRNLHGKCLLCYLLSLAIFQSLFGWIYVNGEQYTESRIACKLTGYTIYFAVQSAFLWLSIISFDLWWNFRKTSGFMLSERRRFIFYTLYAWGIALLLTLITFTMDNVSGISDDFQPKIGNTICYFESGFKRRFIYFYLPQLILCSMNLLFFVLTAIKIRILQMDMKKLMAQGDNYIHQSKLQSEKENFVLFLRLFIVMGVVWIMESISFLVDPKSIYFFIFDMWNCLQGVLIFAFMVCKRRVIRLMKKRYQALIKAPTSSATTHSSSAAYAPNNLAMNQVKTDREKYTEKN